MKAGIWLILAVGMLMAGRAPGVTKTPVAAEEPEMTWRRNPETQEENMSGEYGGWMESRFPRGRWGGKGVALPGTDSDPLYRERPLRKSHVG